MSLISFTAETKKWYVFDVYLESSLKKGVRAWRGPAPTMIIKDNITRLKVESGSKAHC